MEKLIVHTFFDSKIDIKALEVLEISRIFHYIRKYLIALTLSNVVKRSGKFKNNSNICGIFRNTLEKSSLPECSRIFSNVQECSRII